MGRIMFARLGCELVSGLDPFCNHNTNKPANHQPPAHTLLMRTLLRPSSTQTKVWFGLNTNKPAANHLHVLDNSTKDFARHGHQQSTPRDCRAVNRAHTCPSGLDNKLRNVIFFIMPSSLLLANAPEVSGLFSSWSIVGSGVTEVGLRGRGGPTGFW